MARTDEKHRGAEPPAIDRAACTGCELCARDCVAFVIEMRAGRAEVVRPDWCIGCGHCGAVCPVRAVVHGPSALAPEAETAAAAGPECAPEPLERLLRERRSVRAYRPEPVPRALLERLLDAGRFTATGSNSQNIGYVVLAERAKIDALRDLTVAYYGRLFRQVSSPLGGLMVRLAAGKRTLEKVRSYLPVVRHARELMEQGEDRVFFHAPALVVAHAEAADPCSAFNCAAALYSMSLLAHALGLGCCFNGFLEQAARRDRAIQRCLALAPGERVFGAMTVGWPAYRFARGLEREPASVSWL